MTERSGGCLCGAVRFTLRDAPESFGACHCTICQRISGGVNLSFNVEAAQIEITGLDAVRSYRSSEWAERSFCGTCGANLWYRSVTPSDAPHGYSIAFGALDDKSGMVFAKEICVETKPAAYAFAGTHPRLTSEEAFA
ncbi:GFA family protein [Seohaeicola zhoushanensis]|uniref:GFA family protein n=1 Tax=Seohaeicola zhoushanensis TaxID=1569283 RepID=UPI0016762DF1|nr:GFA family protein [Seohaeicola zhoushanensis]